MKMNKFAAVLAVAMMVGAMGSAYADNTFGMNTADAAKPKKKAAKKVAGAAGTLPTYGGAAAKK